MKKETYLDKLASTKVTDTDTVGDAKAAKRVEASLRRFWKRAATTYIERTENVILEPGSWETWKYVFDLKPTGSVLVEVYGHTEMQSPKLMKSYRVPKRHLLT